MGGLDAGEARWAAVADSEFTRAAISLSDADPLVPVVANGIFTPDLVDAAATQQPGNPKPRYPEPLRDLGIEADVNVQFVVDTTGKVDEPTIEFTSQAHRLFMDAIRASLHRARFFPAKLAGTLVPQLVQQEFRFQLRDR